MFVDRIVSRLYIEMCRYEMKVKHQFLLRSILSVTCMFSLCDAYINPMMHVYVT